MLKKVDRFMFIKKLWYKEDPFTEKTAEVLDLALSLVEEDVAEELRDVVEEILNNPFEYDLDDDFMQELMFEWLDVQDILYWSRNEQIISAIERWITDSFFDALNREDIKIIDQNEVEEELNKEAQ